MTNKLELTWVGKENELKIEPRILIENPELSNTAQDDNTENIVIHGDNLLALKALESKYAGQVKCIYIDPPYNTGNAFDFYDDGVEHSIWLNLMRPRLQILKNLLAEDGFLFVQIDNCEMAYLKVLMDEVFGRNNFVNDIIWKRKGGSVNPKNKLNNNTDFILLYQKSDKSALKPIYSLEDEETQKYIKERFTNIDPDGRRWQASPIISPSYSPTLIYEYKGYQPPPNGWSLSLEKMEQFDREGRLYFPEDKTKRIRRKQFLDEYKGQPIGNLWTDIFVINSMSGERTNFDGGQKPEKLLERILNMSTNVNDLVLDSFLGSGTTAAVAHKMGRRYIGIEMGNHAYTHCKVRLDKVISGEDKGGITKSVNWQGGGGYRFYELAPSLVVEDKFGNPIINKEYNADMLAAAMALHEGFTYAPDDNYYWKQGRNENAYIFTTTAHITADYLSSIQSEMQDGEYLIIACRSYDSGTDKLFKNIKIKKIPQVLLDRCEFGKDNYNLNIIDVPNILEEDE